MATKGQKFRKYSPEFIEAILKEYFENGMGIRPLGKKYGLPHETIKNWIFKAKHPDLIKKGRRGRQKEKNLTIDDYRERYEILKKYQAFLQARRGRK